MRVENYPSYPVALFDRWRSVRIGKLDFRNSNTVETTYKTIVLQHGRAGEGVLTIDRVAGRLADPSRMVLRSDEGMRSEEHTSELQSLMRISYAVFCLKKKQSTQSNITKHNEYT